MWASTLSVLLALGLLALAAVWLFLPDVQRLLRIPQWTAAGRSKSVEAISVGVYVAPEIDLNHRLVFPSRKLADIKLVGLASTSAEGARTLAAKYEIPEAYPTYEEMLSDSGIEAIYIAAPVQQRAELAVQALMANKHVLCLAPLAANARQACDLVVLAAQRRRSLVEAVDYRHHPLVERMRSLIQGNAIGQPRHATVSIKLPWYLRPKKAGDLRTDFNLGGGAAMHLGVHGLYVLRHLLGAEPTIVSAKPRLLDTDKRVDEAMAVELVFDDVETALDQSAREFHQAAATGGSSNGGGGGGGGGGGAGGGGGGASDGSRTASGGNGSMSDAQRALANLRALMPGRLGVDASGAGAGAANANGRPRSPGGAALRRMRTSPQATADTLNIASRRVTATIDCDLRAFQLLPSASVKISGTDGDLHVDNFILPHLMHKLTLYSRPLNTTFTERCFGDDGATPFERQLQAFVEEIKYKIRCCQDRDDPVKTLNLVDQIYSVAGLPPRAGPTNVPQLVSKIEALPERVLEPASLYRPTTPSAAAAGAEPIALRLPATPRSVGSVAAGAAGSYTPSSAGPGGPDGGLGRGRLFRSRTRPELMKDNIPRGSVAAVSHSPPSPSTPASGSNGANGVRAAAGAAAAPPPPRPPLQRASSVLG